MKWRAEIKSASADSAAKKRVNRVADTKVCQKSLLAQHKKPYRKQEHHERCITRSRKNIQSVFSAKRVITLVGNARDGLSEFRAMGFDYFTTLVTMSKEGKYSHNKAPHQQPDNRAGSSRHRRDRREPWRYVRAAALELARPDEGIDLIEISAAANPPVVRLMNYDKFRYEEEKRIKKERARAKDVPR